MLAFNMDTIISSKDARDQFSEILNQVAYAGREFVISRFDKPVAKIIPVKSAYANQDIDMERRKQIVDRIMEMRKVYRGVDLTKIVIKERDREYKRWKR
jgi:prevent-host-death family protein